MKKEVIDYRVDSFVDYMGNERKFIIAAVSAPHNVYKRTISLGVAVCHVDDKFDEEVGLKIATSNAKNSNLKVYANVNGMVNTKVVNALIDQEIEYFKNNPSSHIPGYKQMEKEYKKELFERAEIHAIEVKLNANHKDLLEEMKKLTKEELKDLQKLINA